MANIRWNVGPINKEGLKCLEMSIRSFQDLYPNHQYNICYNQIEKSNFKLKNVILHDQKIYLNHFPICPSNGYQVHWKLYPPKLESNTHEIVIDNDIIIFKKIKEIDLFLENNNYTLLYQGLNKLHGTFDSSIPKGIRINSGIYGTPPNFNFIENINKLNIKKWKNKYDEQGLISSILLKNNRYYIIPLTCVPILESDFKIENLTHPLCCGYHFVGLNSNKNHKSWKDYNKLKHFI